MDYVFWNAIALAFAGGVALNFMPCVFPILSLKIISVAKRSSGETNAIFDSLSYAAGVALSMLLLSTVLLLLRATGSLLGWGFQMQSPVLVGILIHVIFLVGLAFSGFFDISFVGSIPGSSRFGHLGSFFTGALSTLIGTPCAAPFMVSALSFAITQPMLSSIAVFQAMGLGMSFPYMALMCIPGVARLFPKPGAWMENLKQFLAFPMYATAAWLFHVLVSQKGISVLLPTLFSIIALTLGIWSLKLVRRQSVKLVIVSALFAFVVLASLGAGKFTGGPHIESVGFSRAKLSKMLDNKETVFVAVGAEWCLTCKINEKVIESGPVQEFLRAYGVVYMKADWTNMDQEISEYLADYGGSSVPFYALYVKGKLAEPIPQVFSKGSLIDALSKSLEAK